jgi:NAD(P)-dependent dehydrogenase (short-subunit alcohol dehydrogenase family)
LSSLTGKVAWVTGAGSGIGEAAALALAAEGAAVALSGRRREPLQAVADKIGKAGGKALVAPGDLGEQEAAHGIATRVAEEFGRLDILVNNAGATSPSAAGAKLTPSASRSCSTPTSTARSIARRGAAVMRPQKDGC